VKEASRDIPDADTRGKPNPLSVLHIGKYFPPYFGGMETYLRDLIRAQTRQGLDTGALVHRSGISLRNDYKFFNQGERTCKITRAAVWARVLFTPISPTFPWLLRRLIREHKPDVLHFHVPNVSAFWALLLPGARRIPWVIHWHSDVLASEHSLGLRLFYTLYRPFERALLRRSRKIIATSPPYLESSIPLAPYSEKCEIVPLGLDPDTLASAHPKPPKPATDRLRILAIGRLTYYKGFEYLIRAATQVENIDVHLVGTGDLEITLRELARDLGVMDKVAFHGKLSDKDLARQYAACDCLCLPSIERTEAFGMVLLEAMSNGKATVISKVPGSGMGWIVEDGITGLHALPADAASLANCLRYLRDNRDKIRDLGENGRAKFDGLFHIDESAAGVLRVYRMALESVHVSQ
jgi:rhamnosyl/mannosyltransferase